MVGTSKCGTHGTRAGLVGAPLCGNRWFLQSGHGIFTFCARFLQKYMEGWNEQVQKYRDQMQNVLDVMHFDLEK